MPAADETAGWNDVAAISRSWDHVVDDYKVFQAVCARGGTVDDLPAFSPQETRPDGLAETTGGSSSHADNKDEEDKEEHRETSLPGDKHEHAEASETRAVLDEPGTAYTAVNPGLLPPQAVLQDADENMKKLLMSWYYAGYYTGLYEGQQQAQPAQQAQQAQQAPQTQPQTVAEKDEPVHSDGPGDK